MKPVASQWWLYGFVLLQLVLQASLVVPGIGPTRTLLRVATFASSIALLLVVPGGRKDYPLTPLVRLVFAVVGLGLFHPSLNSPLAGLAQIALYVAVWAPVFWVTRIAVTPLVLANVLIMLWVFHTFSAFVGVLQVYDPDRFAPDPEFVRRIAAENTEGLMVELHDGQRVFRPFGLSDTPGGAAVSGSLAALVGLLLVGGRGITFPTLGAVSAAIGMFCIYISHVRSLLVVTIVSVVGLLVLLASRGQLGRAVGVVAVGVGASVASYGWATSVGTGVSDRFASLFEERPDAIYYSNRGVFLQETVNVHIFQYPAGAGLGRYGMMHLYFGDPGNPNSPPLWVEIQPTAWVFDGGVLLLLLGYAAVLGACVVAFRFALVHPDRSVAAMAAAVGGFDLSILVNTTGYCNFLGQSGMMFWMLNAALFVACTEREQQ
jgi:hypothetical protein